MPSSSKKRSEAYKAFLAKRKKCEEEDDGKRIANPRTNRCIDKKGNIAKGLQKSSYKSLKKKLAGKGFRHREVRKIKKSLSPSSDSKKKKHHHKSPKRKHEEDVREEPAKKRAKTHSTSKFVFIVGAGASTEPPASIPTFRGRTGRTAEIIEAAKEATERHYPKMQFAFDQWTSIFTEQFRKKYPKIIRAVWHFWMHSVAGKHPNFAHQVMAELHRRGNLRRAITMNVDNLEYAAGLPVEAVVLEHGSLFVGRADKGGRVRSFAKAGEIGERAVTSVVTVGGTAFDTDEMVKDHLIPDMNGSHLVFVGVSGAIVPDWIFRSRPKRVIVVDPSQSAANQVKLGFSKSGVGAWEVFPSMREFADKYLPSFSPLSVRETYANNDDEPVGKALEWIESYAADFPFD